MNPVIERIKKIVVGSDYTTGPQQIRFAVGWLAVILGFITICFLACTGGEPGSHKTTALRWLIFWTVTPPIYFWIDYFALWEIEMKNGGSAFKDLNEFKHGQELSRNIWLALVALLAGLYFRG